jgi:uncharacterized protein YkwD
MSAGLSSTGVPFEAPRSFLTWSIVLILLSFLVAGAVPAPAEDDPADHESPGTTEATAADRPATDLLDRINRIRGEEGLPILALSPPAEEAAVRYAGELSRGARFSHTDSAGNSADRRYRDAGGTGLIVGEVIGRGPDLEAIIDLWLESPRHREVLLGTDWTRAGAGIARKTGTADEDGTVYATVTFVYTLYAELHLDTRADPEGRVPILTGKYLGGAPPVVRFRGRTMIPRVETSGRISMLLPDGGSIFVVRLGYFDPASGDVTFTDMAVFDREKIDSGG